MSRRRELAAALALAALALAMRLPALGSAGELKGDEALEYLHARAIARDGARPTVGMPTTEGPRVPPHRLYLFAIPLLVDDGPLAVMRFVAALNAAAIPAAFLIGRRDLGRRTALAWALLLAVAPGLVRFGRAIWGPDLLLPISVAVVLALARMMRNPRASAAALPLASLLAHVHYAGVGLAALAAGRSIASGRRAPRPALVGWGLAVVVAAPFAAHELASGFHETRAALAVARGGGRTAGTADRPRASIVVEMLALVSPRDATSPLSPEHAEEAAASVPGGAATMWLATIALALGAVAGVALGARELWLRARTPSALATLALICATAPFLVLPARPHYAIPAAAPLLLAIAAAAARAPRRASTAALVAVALVCAASVLAVRATIVRHLGSVGGEFDVAIAAKLEACRFVARREIAVRSAPRFEYFALLGEVVREREREDASARSRFEWIRHPDDERLRYWIDGFRFPEPREPTAIADLRIVAEGAAPLPGELARFGAVAVIASDR